MHKSWGSKLKIVKATFTQSLFHVYVYTCIHKLQVHVLDDDDLEIQINFELNSTQQ